MTPPSLGQRRSSLGHTILIPNIINYVVIYNKVNNIRCRYGLRKYMYVIQLSKLQVDSASMDSNQDMDVDVELKYAILL